MFSILFTTLALLYTVANGKEDECSHTERFEISSFKMPNLNGCYQVNQNDPSPNIVFESIEKNIVMMTPKGDQYYLIFHKEDGTRTQCSANMFQFDKPFHPVVMSKKGWGWDLCINEDGTAINIGTKDIVLSCGCITEEFNENVLKKIEYVDVHSISFDTNIYQLAFIYAFSLALIAFSFAKLCPI